MVMNCMKAQWKPEKNAGEGERHCGCLQPKQSFKTIGYFQYALTAVGTNRCVAVCDVMLLYVLCAHVGKFW